MMLVALPNAFGDAATNMAIDAALLESLPEGLAAFRHYAWTEPAATFGYAQAYASVASELAQANAKPIPDSARAPKEDFTSSHATIVRRLTGGGIVDHRNDWTYALVLHAALPAAKTPAAELYEHIHRAVGQTLADLGAETRLAPRPKACASPISHIPYPISHIPSPISHNASQCFVTPAANDVLRPDGRKIAGAAMKRSRRGLLVQGSLDRAALPEDFDFSIFQAQLVEALAAALHLPTGTLEDLRPLFQSERIQTEKQRFASDGWNRRR